MSSRKRRRTSRAAGSELFTGHDKANTKTIRLCGQVEESISWALAASTSPQLRESYVLRVDPLRGAAVLAVLVSIEGSEKDVEETIEALDRASGYLRSEVARAINRKRIPTLKFSVLPDAREVGDDQVFEPAPLDS